MLFVWVCQAVFGSGQFWQVRFVSFRYVRVRWGTLGLGLVWQVGYVEVGYVVSGCGWLRQVGYGTVGSGGVW